MPQDFDWVIAQGMGIHHMSLSYFTCAVRQVSRAFQSNAEGEPEGALDIQRG